MTKKSEPRLRPESDHDRRVTTDHEQIQTWVEAEEGIRPG